MTHQEAGKLGGLVTLKAKCGICPHCGQFMKGEYFKQLGSKGGSITAQKHDMSRIGKLGGRPSRGVK